MYKHSVAASSGFGSRAGTQDRIEKLEAELAAARGERMGVEAELEVAMRGR
jgi:hypothetical protein